MTSKILTATQWEKIRNNLNPYYQIVCDAMLHTALRPDSEFWRFTSNLQWYECGVIQLPHIHGIQQARTVYLSNEGKEVVEAMIALMKNGNGKKERNTVRDALRRAATGDGNVTRVVEGIPKKVSRPKVMEPEGINAEMFRKTLVAWLLSCFPEKKHQILHSIGGIGTETLVDYTGLVFGRLELVKIRKHLCGWGETVGIRGGEEME